MTKQKRGSSFVEQAAILSAASLFARFVGFIYRVPLTDLIKEEGIGVYSIAYNIYTFFFILSAAGLPASISKMVSERMAQGKMKDAFKVFKSSLFVAVVFGTVSMLILFFGAETLAGLMNSPSSALSLKTLAPTVLIVSVMAVIRGYYLGRGNATPNAVSQVVDQIFNAFFSVFCAWIFMGMPGADIVARGAAGGTVGTGVGAVVGLGVLLFMFLKLFPEIRQEMRDDKSGSNESGAFIAGQLLRISIPIVIGTAVFSLSNLIDSAMSMGRLVSAGFTESEASVLFGRLSNKYVTITTLPITISTSIASAAIPSISRSNILNKKKELRNKINLAIRMTMMIAIPAAVGIGVLAPQILEMLFPNFPEGGDLLRVGSLSIIFLSITQITTGMLQGIGKVSIPVIAAIIGALVKIPVNYVLLSIPQINILGAVIGTIVFYSVTSVIDWYLLSKYTKMRPDFLGILLKPLMASGIMGMAVFVSYYLSFYLLERNWLSVIFSILVGIVVYIIALVLVKGISKSDLEQFSFGRKIINKIYK